MIRACMTLEEYVAWSSANVVLGSPAPSPCVDCPLSFAVEMRREGCCDGEPGSLIKAKTKVIRQLRPLIRYATEEERVAARRQSWREYKRRRALAAA